jgi:acetyl esterase/lipase
MSAPEPDRTTPTVPARTLAIGGTTLLVLLAVMTLVPTWSMSVLPLVLAARELSPVIGLGALIWILVSRWLFGRWHTPLTLTLLCAAVVCARPITQTGAVIARIASQLGGDATTTITSRTLLARLPSAPSVREQVVKYASADGTPLEMRVFRHTTRAPGPRPTLVVLYGGAWRGGDPLQGARTSRALARRGYVVAAIDYRHAPRFTFPAQLDDVRRSLALVRDSSASWNADTTRMALLGRSAGGHLAELAAYAPPIAGVRAVVAIYAPWNLAEGYRDVPVPDPIGVRTVIGNFIGGAPEAQPARYRDASPSSYVRPGLPPTLLLFGSHDHLVKPEFNRGAAAALRASGTEVVEVELPWAEHGFDLVPAGLGERLAFWTIVAFLDRELRVGHPEPVSEKTRP